MPDLLPRVGSRRARPVAPRRLRPPGLGGRGAPTPPAVPGLPCCRPPSTWPGPRSTCSPVRGGSTCSNGPSRRWPTSYDLILIDCPPSLGVLTINGLTAADAVLIPLQCEALSHRGVGQLLETIADVRAFANADLAVRGVIATMYDDRTRHARHVIEEVEVRYGITVLQPPVRKSIRFAEAPARGGRSSSTHPSRRAPRRTVRSPACSPSSPVATAPPAPPVDGRRARSAGQAGALLDAGRSDGPGRPRTTRPLDAGIECGPSDGQARPVLIG